VLLLKNGKHCKFYVKVTVKVLRVVKQKVFAGTKSITASLFGGEDRFEVVEGVLHRGIWLASNTFRRDWTWHAEDRRRPRRSVTFIHDGEALHITLKN
jgi:hypothetical protein